MGTILRIVLILAVAAMAFQLGRRSLANRSGDGLPGRNMESSAGNLEGDGSVQSRFSEAERLAILRKIAESDTYLDASLKESDSIIRRWVGEGGAQLEIFFEPPQVTGVTPNMMKVVEDAFRRWTRVGGIAVFLGTTRDEEAANVIVRWTDRFPQRRAGQTDLVWRSDGNLINGTLTLATHAPDGRRFSPEEIETVALHEIGHLLGLGHSDDPADVMYPSTSMHDLTNRDMQTARLLYSLPPGSLKGR
ncbi:MAG: matrixin family metalloprotease [Gemmatimonadota bacterium]|nr:matrixin family metalloprotease [Gemmatimonadota bacterium]